MIASSFTDPVLGVDIHFEMVPMPAPVPTPIPNPFTGVVFDPMGLAAGLAMGAVVSAVMGAPILGPVVYWGVFPATNTGTEAKHVPGHILIPPGTAWAPFPKTPKPTIHPGEVPKPGLPVKPEDDAVCVFGSKTVSVMGSNAVRLGDMALSCSEPVRLPSSVVLAIPKGPIILIGGPPSLDLMAAFMASLRTRFVSDSLHALLSRLRPSRFRNLLHRVVCFFTGHPVDVASGKVITDAVDVELPGSIPLKIERVYSSAFASRGGPLGHGWSHSLDQAVWTERGRVVLLADDGREIEFDTFDLPDRVMMPGHEVWNPIDRLLLRCQTDGRWQVIGADGQVREFAPVPGRADGRAPLQRIRSRGGSAVVSLDYDRRGRLCWVRDSAGRTIAFDHDDSDRLVALRLPDPDSDTWYVHRQYAYDGEGDLVRVTDAHHQEWRFEYTRHLLVKETDRNGLSFHFLYDGLGEDACCVRTWGDGGIYDHEIVYDKKARQTFVTDSLGHTKTFQMNLAGQVIKVRDAIGAVTTYEYDPRTLQKTKETGPLGGETTWQYDARGNCTKVIEPDGAAIELAYDDQDQPVRALDARGGEWRWGYDGKGRMIGRADPLGRRTQFRWEGERLIGLTDAAGHETRVSYDDQGNVQSLLTPDGAESRWQHDRLGRCLSATDAKGNTRRFRRDRLGRAVWVREPGRGERELEYDAEGNLTLSRDAHQEVKYVYGGMGRPVSRTEGATTVSFAYDTEERLVGVRNEHGDMFRFEVGPTGQIDGEIAFGGAARRYVRDKAGRVLEVVRPGGLTTAYGYDAAGRVTAVQHSDGTAETYQYDKAGAVVAAINAGAAVVLLRDALGRVTRETVGDDWVASEYDALGMRTRVRSSKGLAESIRRDGVGRVVGMRASMHGEGNASLEEGGRPSGAQAWEAVITRDAVGLEIARSLPGGVRSRWERDPEGRPLVHETTVGELSRGSAGYAWEASDRLRMVVDSMRGPVRFQRDPAGNLLAAVRDDARADVRLPDALGNLFRTWDRSDRRYGPMGQLLEARDEGGRVTRFEYDLEGNLTAKIQSGGGTDAGVGPDAGDGGPQVWRYRWNGAGMLVEVVRPDGEVVAFVYDALGRRLSKRYLGRTTRFIWDRNVPLHEWVEAPAPISAAAGPPPDRSPADARARRLQAELAARPAVGPPLAAPPAEELGTPESPVTWLFDPETFAPAAKLVGDRRYSIVTDHLGSPAAMYDAAGQEVWSASLDVYGRPDRIAGSRATCPFRWPGQYDDPETGLHYNRFRYYDPASGSYISQDPLGPVFRSAAYVGDPTRAIDPFGLLEWADPSTLNFSQAYVTGETEGFERSMRDGTWDWNRTSRSGNNVAVLTVAEVDGQLVSFDNRRLLAAQNAELDRVAIQRVNLDDIKPGTTITWGESLRRRLNSSPAGSGLPRIQLPPTGTSDKPRVVTCG